MVHRMSLRFSTRRQRLNTTSSATSSNFNFVSSETKQITSFYSTNERMLLTKSPTDLNNNNNDKSHYSTRYAKRKRCEKDELYDQLDGDIVNHWTNEHNEHGEVSNKLRLRPEPRTVCHKSQNSHLLRVDSIEEARTSLIDSSALFDLRLDHHEEPQETNNKWPTTEAAALTMILASASSTAFTPATSKSITNSRLIISDGVEGACCCEETIQEVFKNKRRLQGKPSKKLSIKNVKNTSLSVMEQQQVHLLQQQPQSIKRIKCEGRLVKGKQQQLIDSSKIEELICSCETRMPKESSNKNNLNNKTINNNNDEIRKDEQGNLVGSESAMEKLGGQQPAANVQLTSQEDELVVYSPRIRVLSQPHKLVSLGERNGQSICNKHMPWFGIDVGGSLIKVAFFDPKEATREEMNTLRRIRRYLKSSKAYGTTGKRDTHLEMPNCVINKRAGSLHFIRFATSQMPEFLTMAKNKRFADTINTVCATGGGAYKFEEDIKSNLGIHLHKTDELDSIIYGIHYIDKYNSERECYYLEDPLNDAKCVKVPYDFSRPYPYLVVNIGSGVSILAVYSSTSYSRISGSSIGGGTFLGLCCLLTQCKTFDEAIKLAKAGSSTKIDKLVKDIYGGDYPKFNLSGDTVASSFGHMNMIEKRKEVKREDLARALLEMVTINIGSIARMCAANEDIDRVVFIGNFLRVNQLSMKLLSYAVNYWSKGAMKALFLEHEGYFGAVGCFVESTQGCHL